MTKIEMLKVKLREASKYWLGVSRVNRQLLTAVTTRARRENDRACRLWKQARKAYRTAGGKD